MDSEKRIKNGLFGLLGLLLLLTLLSSIGYAQIPQKMNYQGYLTNAAGVPVNGTVQMVFSIYNASSGGVALWTEVHSVTVSQGVYSVILGEGSTPNPINLTFDTTYYLGVQVGADPEMTPRKILTSVGYAFRALTVESIGSHNHSGADITSGTVSEARIDSLIARDSEVSSSISTHTANVSAHHTRYTNAEAVAAIKAADGSGSGLDADLLDGQHASAFVSAGQVYTKAEVDSLLSALQSRIAALEAKLSGFTRSGSDFIITNANLYIQSGSTRTDGVVNGKGNLIIGYNELRGSGDVRTGSHNLIVGSRHNYSKYGGIVVGYNNAISGSFSSVSGGYGNTASGSYSLASGGVFNNATGDYSSVSGGVNNTAGHYSSVSGGSDNTASGFYSSVSGGRYNIASGDYSSVAGGGSGNASYGNRAFGHYSAILGGDVNIAGDPALTDHSIGQYSTVCGGGGNMASGSESSISGGLNNTASGSRSSVSGGAYNTATNLASSVSGGRYNIASGNYSSVAGGGGDNQDLGNKAFGHYTSILGGSGNKAGDPALADHTIGQSSTASGGQNNNASGLYSSVSGGTGNTASALSSSVSGGVFNYAIGAQSSVSGGFNRSATGLFDWVAGGLWQEE